MINVKKKKKSGFKKAKLGVLGGIIGGILVICLIAICLIYHLFSIQTTNRLNGVKDYNEFTLTIQKRPFCENEIITLFSTEKEIYNGMCIEKVFVNYGRTRVPLERAIEGGYITLKDITKKMSNVDEVLVDDITHLVYQRSSSKDGNYYLTIANKNYQTKELKEITFEILNEE